jgi:hypothetical protein
MNYCKTDKKITKTPIDIFIERFRIINKKRIGFD